MDKLRVETIELIKQIYKKYPSGSALHIVLADDNAEDRELLERCATNLLKLGTERKRRNCIAKAFDDMRKEDEGK